MNKHEKKTADNPDILAAASAAYWAAIHPKTKLTLAHGGPFSLEGREYQAELLDLRCPEVCYMKATGGGFSEVEIIRTIHALLYGRYPQGAAYYFPTDTDMYVYVKSRFNPLIAQNPDSIGQYMRQETGKQTDSAELKRIGNANLYLRGASMNITEGRSKISTKLSAIHVDAIRLDEIDQMDEEVIAKARGRLANAQVDGIKGNYELVYIANPSDQDRGIDLIWQRSDQSYWFRYCTSCGEWTCAEKEFWEDPEKCVGFYPDKQARMDAKLPTGYIRCKKCQKPVSQRIGKWIPDYPSRSSQIRGFHWSHLTSEYKDPAKLLHDYRNPPEGNLGDFIRLELGRPYSAEEDRLQKEHVYACCTNEGIPTEHPGPCAMGIDNDDNKHIIIGCRLNNEQFRILKFLRSEQKGFEEALDLIQKFNIKSAVSDLRPNADSARQFQKDAARRGCRVWLCEYTESPLHEADFNENQGVVKCYRTGIFDESHRIIMNRNILLPRRSAALDALAEQLCNCVKTKEQDKKRNIIVFRYRKTGNGNDHYRNALNYFLLACRKVSRFHPTRTDSVFQRKAIHHTVAL
ncbi:MAG TPA: phage terminase large subunit family protein [Anaerohalosphaeraceae bacterium]|nr:phage terminase large subunit family protein [Anaerohalosphaeraceae bacterium]